MIDEPLWPRALTLPERLLAFRADPQSFGDSDRAERRLDRWRRRAGLDDHATFQHRLVSLGISKAELVRVFDAPPGAYNAFPEPEWAVLIGGAVASPAATCSSHAQSSRFELAVQLRINQVHACAGRLLQQHPAAPFTPAAAVDAFLLSLQRDLAWITCRTLALDPRASDNVPPPVKVPKMNAPRRLWPIPPHLAPALFRSYPVLARLVAIALRRWADFVCLVLGRLAADWHTLMTSFRRWRPTHLSAAAVGYPDQNGEAAVAMSFGGGPPLVYLPHSLALDAVICELLALLNQAASSRICDPLPVLDRGTYGWKLHPQLAFGSAEENFEVCRQVGAMAALRHILGGLNDPRREPCRSHDISRMSPYSVPSLDLSVGQSGLALWPECRCEPLLQQLRITDPIHRQSIADACISTLETGRRFRSHLLSDAVVDRLATCQYPLVARSQMDHLRIVFESLHPDVLGDALDRELVFEVTRGCDSSATLPAPVRQAERQAAQSGFMPVFFPRLRDTILDVGGAACPHFFAEGWPVQFKRRSAALCDVNIDREMRLALGVPLYVALQLPNQKGTGAAPAPQAPEHHRSESVCAETSLERYVLSLIHRKAYEAARSVVRAKTVLDWGCSDGYGLEILRPLAREVYGLDVDLDIITAAKARPMLAGADIRLYDGLGPAFGNLQVDVITSFQVIEHVMDPDAYLHALVSTLARGGVAMFSTPNAGIRLNEGMGPWNPQHARELTWRQFAQVLRPWFSAVAIYGLFAENDITAIERRRIAIHRMRQFAGATGLPDPDFPLTPLTAQHKIRYRTDQLCYRRTCLDEALDLLAVCRR